MQERTPPAHTQQPQFYTADQLQAAVDSGRITPAKMAEQLAWQAKETAKREIKTEWQTDQRRSSAVSEVNQYLDKIPALGTPGSPEHARVRRAAVEIADDMGLDLSDPRVQRLACRQALGTLDRIAKTSDLREFDRKHADTHVETQGGGGTRQPSSDPLKHVPKALMDHWKKLNYSPERMKGELPYIDLEKWKRKG